MLFDQLSDLLASWGMSADVLMPWTTAISSTLSLALAYAVYLVITKGIIPVVLRFVAFTEAKWDDILFNPPLLRVVAELAFVLVLQATLLPSLTGYVTLHGIATVGCRVAIVCVIVHLINRFLGAAATVLMLVFKDSIMGVVAGVQLTLNDMLRPGDWITVPARHINGTVLEVGLTTVKVKNFDNTIVTVPPYSLVSESFQNWRGMSDSGGRRVNRSFTIDVNSVTFCTPEMIESFRGEEWGRRLDPEKQYVNLTLFRHYLEHYISTLPQLNNSDGMLYMVRELAPTPQGIPLDLYLFTSLTSWKPYEHFQAGIMDHIVASVHRFGLRIYQAPSGLDFRPQA